ncbi:MAG: hypothetical protein HY680_00530 [Chloroflexi bacterium]|nr:hypothetical protein [Chloroflexota bacterium]
MKPANRLLPLLLLFALAVLAGAACAPTTKTVRGHVLDVQARSLTEVASLSLQDSSGEVWRFFAEGNIGFTPSHIREHQMQGHELTVSYRERDGELVAVHVTD